MPYVWQVDLQSSEKDNERLSAELRRLQTLVQDVGDVRRENQELNRRLSQQEARPDGELQVGTRLLKRLGLHCRREVVRVFSGVVRDRGPTATGHSGEVGR